MSSSATRFGSGFTVASSAVEARGQATSVSRHAFATSSNRVISSLNAIVPALRQAAELKCHRMLASERNATRQFGQFLPSASRCDSVAAGGGGCDVVRALAAAEFPPRTL